MLNLAEMEMKEILGPMNKKIEEFSLQLKEEIKKSSLPDESSLGLYCYDLSAQKNRSIEEGSLIYFSEDEPVAKFLVRDGKIYVTPTTENMPIKYKEKKYPLKSGIEVNPESMFELGGHKFLINDLREMDKESSKAMLGKQLVQKTISSKNKKLEQHYEEMEEVESQLSQINSEVAEIKDKIKFRGSRINYLEQLHVKYTELKMKIDQVKQEAQSVQSEVDELNEHDYQSMLEELHESELEYNEYYTELEAGVEKIEKDLKRRQETQVNKQETKKEKEMSAIEQEEAELLRKLQELEAKKKDIS